MTFLQNNLELNKEYTIIRLDIDTFEVSTEDDSKIYLKVSSEAYLKQSDTLDTKPIELPSTPSDQLDNIDKLFEEVLSKIPSIIINGTEIIDNVKNIKIKIFLLDTDNDINLLRNYKNYNIKNGYNTLIFYEDDIRDRYNLVLDKILFNLGFSTEFTKIHARKCIIKEIPAKEKNDFLNKNHLQGKDNSKVYLGAYYNDELVGVMCFTNNRGMNGGNDNEDLHELTRFCVKLNYKINGLASKILKVFVTKYNPEIIISFADKRTTVNEDNNLYTNLDFTQVESKKSCEYYYYKEPEKTRRHKFGFGKNKIQKNYPEIYNPKLTERQMTLLLGYKKIFDVGRIKFEKIYR